MIELYISGQSLRIYTPVIAADTLNYLTVQAYFLDDDWEGYTRWVHFRKGNSLGTEVFDLLLDGNNSITEDKGLNLSVGEWTVYLSGNREGSRLTTAPVIITVKESGLVDAPLHALPLSVAEQIANDAAAALACAREVKAAALAGAFDGRDGTSFIIEGFFDTPEALEEGVPSPTSGQAYGVGMEAPYEIYIWDGINRQWRNNGEIQGAKGSSGDPGATFRPSVDADGNISWTNDGGLLNPATQNIRGPAGQDGERGPAGASASIVIQTDNLENGAVTAAKLSSGAVSTILNGNLTSTGWNGTEAPYSQSIFLTGMRASDTPFVDVVLSGSFATDKKRLEDFGQIYRVATYDGTITAYAISKPTVALPLRFLCIRK